MCVDAVTTSLGFLIACFFSCSPSEFDAVAVLKRHFCSLSWFVIDVYWRRVA